MTRDNRPVNFFASIYIRQFFIATISLSVLLFSVVPSAQNSNPTDGSTPAGLKPGAPSGSYGLSGFDNVNLYNGNLNFRLPLLRIGGRGSAGYTMTLPIEQHWTMDNYGPDQDGFISSTPNGNWWDIITPGYGVGVMQRREVGTMGRACPPPPNYEPTYTFENTITRLTFTAADGTEIEFVDQQTGGQFHFNPQCATSPYSRGKVFVSHDGSAATFISDSDVIDPLVAEYAFEKASWADTYVSGYLFLRDGTRYRISGGYVSQIRDRNGNTLTFTSNANYDLIITDSLNRQVTVNYNYQDSSPYGLCDRITFKGFGGATRIIRISKTSLSNALKSGWQTNCQFFGSDCSSNSGTWGPTVVSAIWLPNDDGGNRHYQFYYNVYAELSRVELPTGGAYEYDWGAGLTGATGYYASGAFVTDDSYHYQVYRRVLEKRVYSDGSTLEGRTVFTSPEGCNSGTGCSGATSSPGYATVDEKDASGNLLARQRHYFNGGGAAASIASHDPTAAVDDMEGRETETRSYAADGTTLLRKVVNTWTAASVLGQGPHLTEVDSTLSDTNQVTKETFAYDNYGNRTDSYEYDFGSGAAGSLVRHTQTTYLTTNDVNSAAYDTVNPSNSSPSISATIHIRSLPWQTSVYDSGGMEWARTRFEYDNYASDTNHASLVGRTSISGLDSTYTASLTTRGNVTATTHYLLNSSG